MLVCYVTLFFKTPILTLILELTCCLASFTGPLLLSMENLRSASANPGRSWLSHVDSLLAPFNIDKNRWVGVLVHLPSHTLTVFDPTATVRRRTRLKPELDFICQMFPYLVRKVGDNELTKNFPLHPLTFDRNTHVAQASDVANSGMLSLLFLEAHATGGLDKVYLVTERDMRQRAEQLVVEMYEHCFGDLGAA